MPKFAANLTMLFNELPFLERFAAAASAGFEAVEFLFPYEYPIEELRGKLSANELKLVLHNLPAGNWAAGERGIACLPDRVEEFREGVAQGVRYATALGCRQVNCLAGIPGASADPQAVRRTFVSNLQFAAKALADAGLMLLTEPINTRDIPGFYLNSTRQALELIDAVGAPNLKLQYDVYHMQIMEGDLSHTIETQLGRIGHMQIADTPGRNEPGSGEINYEFLFRFIDSVGYAGWIGCEYKPQTQTTAGLGWMRNLMGSSR
jgi:hydroxypyruvate isomerase